VAAPARLNRVPYDSRLAADPDVLMYPITGAFFFGAASTVGMVLDSIADTRKAFVVDFSAVPFLDSTAANTMSRVGAKANRQGIRLFITGASPTVSPALLTHGVRPPRGPEVIDQGPCPRRGKPSARTIKTYAGETAGLYAGADRYHTGPKV
jgi:SulP family sulfate permease